MLSREDIATALRGVAVTTAESDAKIATRLSDLTATGHDVPYVALRGAAQALLTGESVRARSHGAAVAPYARWGSWIEGVPFAHALLFNEGLIVDVIPCATEKAFRATYHCEPRQFLDILSAIRDADREVFFNFRGYDPARPATIDAYTHANDGLGLLFEHFADHDFADCYVNASRSKALIGLFDPTGRMDAFEDMMGGLADDRKSTALFSQLEAALAPANHALIAREHPGAMVRGPKGQPQVPAPIQIFKRVAYHLAFGTISPDIPRDDLLWSLPETIGRGEMLAFATLMDVSRRATELHHAHTAPLTGAYGGTYNLSEQEAAPRYYAPIGRESTIQKTAYLEFLYATIAGKIRADDGALKVLRDVGGAMTLMQAGEAPTDRELREYLDFLPDSRDFLRKRARLEEALTDRIRHADGDPTDVESYVLEAERAYRRVNGFWSKLGKNLFLGLGAQLGGGVGFVAANLGFLGSVIEMAAEKSSDAFSEGVFDRFVARRHDSKQIVRIIDSHRG